MPLKTPGPAITRPQPALRLALLPSAGAVSGQGEPERIPPPYMIVSRAFPGQAEHVCDVRRWVQAHLPPCPARDDLALIASELAANAIVHTASGRPGGQFSVCLACSPQRARVVIADGGAEKAPVLVTSSDGERQRGLALVDHLSAGWAYTGDHQSRWTWADVVWDGPAPHVPSAETDVGREVARLRHAHPGVIFWYGTFTGTWWAAFRDQLFDAPCPAALHAMAADLPARLHDLRETAMTDMRCACGFTESGDETLTDHLLEVFTPRDCLGNDGQVHEEAAGARLTCLCGYAAATTGELDQHFLDVFAPGDAIGGDGARHQRRRRAAGGSISDR